MFLKREDTAVLVIDIQERLLKAMDNYKQLLKETIKLLKGCTILRLPILATEQYPKGLGPTVPEVASLIPDENIYSKNSFSGYIPAIKNHLNTWAKRSILLLGIEAHVCIFQTCCDLLEDGYSVYIPIECVSSRSHLHAKNALRLMDKMGAWIVNVEMVLFALLKTKDAPEFRQILDLVK